MSDFPTRSQATLSGGLDPPLSAPTAENQSPTHSIEVPAIALLVAIVLTYLPALTLTYGFADDFPQLLEATTAAKWIQQAWNVAARPVGGFLTEWSFHAVNNIDGLAYLRAMALLLVLALGILVRSHLSTLFGDHTLANLGMIFVCTQAPFQVYVGWASMWLYMIPPILSYFAYRQLIGERLTAIKVATAIVTLYVALNIYPPGAMFLWFWVGADAIFSNTKIRLMMNRFLVVATACGVSLVCHYAIYRLQGYTHNRGQLTTEPGKKLRWFFGEVLPQASRMQWFEWRSLWFFLCIWAVIVVGLFVLDRRPVSERVVRGTLCLAALFLSYTPLLVVQEYEVSFRSQIAITALVGILFLVAADRVLRGATVEWRVRNAVLIGLVLAGVVKAETNLTGYIATPQAYEYLFVKSRITSALTSEKKVVLMQGDLGRWLAHGRRWDEFHLITAVMPDEYHMLNAMAQLIVRAKADASGRDPAAYNVEVVTNRTKPVPATDTRIVDMEDFTSVLDAQ